MALVELAREVGLNASTALRQLRALEAAGFASRRKDGDWEPGPELLRIARSLVAHATLPRLAAPVLADIAARNGRIGVSRRAGRRRIGGVRGDGGR